MSTSAAAGAGLPLLRGFKALDLSTTAAAHCGRILAGWGVEVTHIDLPTLVEESRTWRIDQQIAWRSGHHGKTCITLDYAHGEHEAFLARVRSADFVIESFTPGYLASIGLDYATLARANPRIILVSVTPFGQQGPYSTYRGNELIAAALSGTMYGSGDADRPPVKEPLDANFFHGCAAASLGAIIAHHHRQLTGEGQHVDLSVQEAGVSRNTTALQKWQFDRINITRDGPYLKFGKAVVRCIWKLEDGFAFWSMASGRFGAPANTAISQWMSDLGYHNPMRDTDWNTYDRSALDADLRKLWEAAIAKFFADRTRAEIAGEGRRRGTNCTPAAEPGDVLHHPQLVARGLFGDTQWPGSARSVAMPRYFVRAGTPQAGVAPLPAQPGIDNGSDA